MHNSQGLEKVLSLRQEILAGDEKRLKEQRDAGKLTARERIAKIADAGSFVELFALVSRNDEGAGVVTGYATIEERPVYLFAQDFTVRGGAMGQLQAAKIVKLLELAQKTGAPVLALMDSAGVRIDEGAQALSAYSEIYQKMARMSGVCPMVALVLGPCIGGAACRNKVFQFYRYNEECMASWEQTAELFGQKYDPAAERFYEKFYDGNYYGVDLTDRTLGLGRLFVLATGSTASASEALVNGLRGIGFEVTLIGERTNGKNVGMNVFEWRDLEGYDYEFAPITFQGYNAEMRTVDPAGIEPDFAVSETESGWFEDFGPGEPLLRKALELIGAAVPAPAPTRSAAVVGAVPRGPVRNASVHPSGMIGPRGIVPEETGTENGEKAGCDKKQH